MIMMHNFKYISKEGKRKSPPKVVQSQKSCHEENVKEFIIACLNRTREYVYLSYTLWHYCCCSKREEKKMNIRWKRRREAAHKNTVYIHLDFQFE